MIPTLARFDLARGVVALVIAAALFGVVRNETNPAETANFEVAVALRDVPPGMFPEAGARAPSVRVRISAPHDTITGIQPGDFHASVDLRSSRVGLGEQAVAVEVPDPKVRVIEVVPAQIPVRLEGTDERRVPVRVNRTGNVAFGYDAGPTEMDPAEVQISGPTSVVARIASVGTELKMDGVTVNVDANAAITPLDAQGRSISETQQLKIAPPSVHVQVAVTQQLSYKTVAIQPSLSGSPQNGLAIQGITIEPAAVTLAGAPGALGALNFATTERIDVSDASSTLARQVSVLVPPGVFVVQQDLVRVTVRIAPLSIAQPVTTSVTADNLPADVRLAGPVPAVQVTLDGPASAFQQLGFGDVRARVDLNGLGRGTHSLPVQGSAPADFTVVGVTPETVTITLDPAPAPAAAESSSASSITALRPLSPPAPAEESPAAGTDQDGE